MKDKNDLKSQNPAFLVGAVNGSFSKSDEDFMDELILTYKKDGAIKYILRLIKSLKNLPKENERESTIERLKVIKIGISNYPNLRLCAIK